jgi:hypothetical protein
MVAITVDLKTKGLALRPGASLQCRAFMKFHGSKALNDKLPVTRLPIQVERRSQFPRTGARWQEADLHSAYTLCPENPLERTRIPAKVFLQEFVRITGGELQDYQSIRARPKVK